MELTCLCIYDVNLLKTFCLFQAWGFRNSSWVGHEPHRRQNHRRFLLSRVQQLAYVHVYERVVLDYKLQNLPFWATQAAVWFYCCFFHDVQIGGEIKWKTYIKCFSKMLGHQNSFNASWHWVFELFWRDEHQRKIFPHLVFLWRWWRALSNTSVLNLP